MYIFAPHSKFHFFSVWQLPLSANSPALPKRTKLLRNALRSGKQFSLYSLPVYSGDAILDSKGGQPAALTVSAIHRRAGRFDYSRRRDLKSFFISWKVGITGRIERIPAFMSACVFKGQPLAKRSTRSGLQMIGRPKEIISAW